MEFSGTALKFAAAEARTILLDLAAQKLGDAPERSVRGRRDHRRVRRQDDYLLGALAGGRL